MNIYGIIILTTILLDFILSITADLLNLGNLDRRLPAEFEDTYKPEIYSKSQEYTRVQTLFGFLTSSLELIVTLLFWFLGGFNALDQIVRSWGLPQLLTGLAYIGLLILAQSLISLPFHIYSTFVIEEKFGFNKTTLATFITDILKMLLLAVFLGGPLLAGVLLFFQYAGVWAWIYCWIVTTTFMLFIQFIAPVWIMPLFNKFTPLAEGSLRQKIMAFANKVHFPVQDIFVIDGSKRSSKSNAFFTGYGKNKRIALYDTLMEKHTDEELVSVLAHEIGHYKLKHIIIGLLIGIAHTGFLFFLLSIFISHKGLFEAFYMENMSIYAGLLFFGLLYSPIELVLSIMGHLLSRTHEYQADHFVLKNMQNPENFIQALKKLSAHNLSNLTPHPFYVFLNYSHPTVLQRINRIKH